MEERISKILSAAGLSSRRQGEIWIQEGRVAVNGIPAQLGQKADAERDEITVDGKPISCKPKTVCLLLHKPRGYVTTMADEQGRPTVANLIADCGYRLYPVGRLDLNSEGLLLMTNDGELTNRLTHPRHQVEKEYQVRVTGAVETAVPKLCQPMRVDGDDFNAAKVRILRKSGESTLLSVTISQGKNRQVRRMCKAVGLTVHRLRRVREGSILLGNLPSGKWRWLTESELDQLRRN